MRRTAVVRAGAEPLSPRRQTNGGSTGGSEIRSTSTAAIRIAGDHHTNDHLLSRPLTPPLSPPLRPGRLDMRSDPVTRELAVAVCERVVYPAVLARRALELRAGRHAGERRGDVAGTMGRPADRPPAPVSPRPH